MKSELILFPLGGLGQIGMNMMLIEYGQEAIIVDCGVMFPDTRHFGVNLIIPDFSYIKKNKHKIKAVLLTHGHEDHIGAIPYLLKHINPKIYASSFTIALLRAKLSEFSWASKAKLHTVSPNKRLLLGKFKAEFIQVTHSIVDGMGIAIETPVGRIVHTGDFKIDETPYRGKSITLKKFEQVGNKGVLCLLSDSTNVEREGKSLTEAQIGREIEKICRQAKGKLIFSVFATNIHRVERMLTMAKKLNRKVVLSGRSMESHIPLAARLGFVEKNAASQIIDIKEMKRYSSHELMIVCTGSQAEERSALQRIAQDEHRHIKIQKDDVVILSSRFIPGNEKAISDLINSLCRLGAEVFYDKVADVHVSGHAHAGELRRMIKAVRPKYFIPVHGEYRHLVRHAHLAEEMKIAKQNIFVCENGDRVAFQADKSARRISPIELDRVFIEDGTKSDLEAQVVKDRKKISLTGMIIVALVRDKASKRVIRGPELTTLGVLNEEKEAPFLSLAKKSILDFSKKFKGSTHEFKEELRLRTRRIFKNKIGKKAIVKAIVIDL